MPHAIQSQRAASRSGEVASVDRARGTGAAGMVECKRNYVAPHLAEVIFDSYEGERNTAGFFHGQGTATLIGGHSYEGEFCDGYMHGTGTLRLAGSEYSGGYVQFEGDFVSGRPLGRGKITWTDGSYYVGDVVDGIRHGQGTYCHQPSATLYSGQWENGIREGKGSMVYDYKGEGESSSGRYEGMFVQNTRHGRGKLCYRSGNWYDGDWVNGVRHGWGSFFWAERNQLGTGHWIQGTLEGKGELRWLEAATPQHPTQTHYVGEIVDGKRHGQGTLYYSTGAVYSGGWKDSVKDGRGKIQTLNGVEFEGDFQDDRFKEMLSKQERLEEGHHDRSPSLFGGGTNDSDITSLAYILGDIDEATGDGFSTAKTYNSRIKELIGASYETDMREYMIEIHTVLLDFMRKLLSLYDYYACVGKTAEEIARCRIMTRYQFWILAHDSQLHEYGLRLAEIDRITDVIDCPAEDLHNPDHPVLLRDFLVWLTCLAIVIYSEHEDVLSHRFPLAACLARFLTLSLTPGACEHQALLYKYESVSTNCREYMTTCRDVFKVLRAMPVPGTHTLSKRDGEEKLPTARHFVVMMKIYGLICGGITMAMASDAITAADPAPVASSRPEPNMDVEITLYQFLNALVFCALQYQTGLEVTGDAESANDEVLPALATTTVERYMQLFQSRHVHSVCSNSNSTLDAVSASPPRLSGTPSQTTLAALPNRRAGSAVVVDSPVPEEVAEHTLTPISTSSQNTPIPPTTVNEDETSTSFSGSLPSSQSLTDTSNDMSAASLAGEDADQDADLKHRLYVFFRQKLIPAHEKWMALHSIEADPAAC